MGKSSVELFQQARNRLRPRAHWHGRRCGGVIHGVEVGVSLPSRNARLTEITLSRSAFSPRLVVQAWATNSEQARFVMDAVRPPFVIAFACAVACAVALGSCAAAPPPELRGLWARGEGGCQSGTGLVFERDAVLFVAGETSDVLLRDPRYSVSPDGEVLRVAIRYALVPGLFGPRQAGEVDLIRRSDGWLAVTAHRPADGRSGYARLRSPDADPLYAFMHTKRCGPGAWITDLRGRAGVGPQHAATADPSSRREALGEGDGRGASRDIAQDPLRGRGPQEQNQRRADPQTHGASLARPPASPANGPLSAASFNGVGNGSLNSVLAPPNASPRDDRSTPVAQSVDRSGSRNGASPGAAAL